MIDELVSFDRNIFLVINQLHYPWLNSTMVLLSSQTIWLPFLFYVFWHSYKNSGLRFSLFVFLFLALTLAASDVSASYLFKNIFTRLRPCREIDLKPLIYSFGQKCGGKYGFVSSHAANAFALFLFSIRIMNLKKKWISLILLLPLLVAYSRIYLGVHYPADIVFGSLIGIFWAIFFSKLFFLRQGASLDKIQD